MQLNTQWRLKWYPATVLIVLTVVFFVCLFSGDGAQILSGRLGGDFPAFYGAGRIILDGDVDQLYSVDRQLSAQSNLHEDASTYLSFAYPPFVALPYAILALFPYKIAYLINTVLMLCALKGILNILFEKYDISRKYYLLVFVLSLSFFPIFKALFGGQNTLLSLLLLCLLWVYVDSNEQVRAGVFLGLMLFKPQFALPLIGLMLLSRRWAVVLSSLATGVLLYVVCIVLLGTGWVLEWLDYALWFSQKDAVVNSTNAVSWLGFLGAILGPNNSIVLVFGVMLSVVTSVLLSLLWMKRYASDSITKLMPITCLSLILIPSHTMYYDSGLILIACFAISKYLNNCGQKFILFVWFASFSQLMAQAIGFSPIFFINIICLIAAIYLLTCKENDTDLFPVR